MLSPILLLTCEHSRREIPREFKSLFAGAGKVLASHRAWDEGAAPIADYLARALKAPVFHGKFSRLVVDLNRTPDHPKVFSEWTKGLLLPAREKIIHRIHRVHWDKVRGRVARYLHGGHTVIHLGVHSFVPVLNGHRRKTDIGLLFDSGRKVEREFCRGLKHSLETQLDFSVHFNLPYRGGGNGLTTALRAEFPRNYLGIELEINQRLLPKHSREISAALAATLAYPCLREARI